MVIKDRPKSALLHRGERRLPSLVHHDRGATARAMGLERLNDAIFSAIGVPLGADDLGLVMRRSFVRMGFSCALLVITSCVARPQQQTVMLEWASPDRRVVLVQSTFDLEEDGQRRLDWNEAARMRALGHLKDRSAESGFTLIVTNPDIDEIDSLYGSCLGVDAISYAWQSHACADLVREHYRADYALFLSSEITYDMRALGMNSSSSLSLIDLRNGEMVWSNKRGDGDWRDDRSARTAIQNLLADSPL
jgi:hypothetical protein